MSRAYLPYLLITVIAALLFIPFLGSVHLFDWDEINFAECAREMIRSGDYSIVQIGYLPFWEKPPLFIWMQAASMNVFGINEFAARLPNAIAGIVTLLVIYHSGKRIYEEKFARIWTLVYAGTILPGFYFHSGIIDPWFNLFIFLSIQQFVLYQSEFPYGNTTKKINTQIVLSAVFMSLAVLTKGPVALLVFGICFLIVRIRTRKPVITWPHFILYALVVLSIPAIWFVSLALKGKSHLILEFILYQIRLFNTEDAGHGGSFFYHWIVLLVGCFPASIFAIQALIKKKDDTSFELLQIKWMRLLFWVVLILFSFVKTKIIHYSSLCYFPLTYLAAYSIYKIQMDIFHWKKWQNGLLLAIGIVFALFLLIVPFIDHFKQSMIAAGMIGDKFAVGNLGASGAWKGFEWIAGIILLAVLINFLLQKNKGLRSIYFLFGGTLIALNFAAVCIAPRVEAYSQNAAITWWKNHTHDNAYLETIGYKSYAHYFYGEVKADLNTNPNFLKWKTENKDRLYNAGISISENEINMRREWMLRGPVDKPCFFICKNTSIADVKQYYPELELIKQENGFACWKREPIR
jgi:4-amino-4-deoxy-L-arabinose transferase-like glycosyltransferase